MTNGVAQHVLHGLGQRIEVAEYLAALRQFRTNALAWPARFEAGVLAKHLPQRFDVHRLTLEAGLLAVQPGQFQGVVRQLLHAAHLAFHPVAQLFTL